MRRVFALLAIIAALAVISPAQQVLPAIGSTWKGSGGGGGGITFVQGKGCFNSTAATSEACAFTGNVTASNTILVACSAWEGVHGFNTPTDTLGSTFTSVLDVNSNGGGATTGEEIHLYKATVPVGGGADTVTCAFGAGSDFIQVSIREISGASTVDQTGTLVPATATNTCSVTSGVITTGNEYVWVVCAKDQQGAWSLGTGYADLVSVSNTGGAHGQGSEDNILSGGSGAQTGTMTVAGTAGNMTGAIVTLK